MQPALVLMDLIRFGAVIALLVALGAVILVLYRAYERLAGRALKRAYAELEPHPANDRGAVRVVYHTYHGFLLWYTETEHRATLPPDEATELLCRLLRFNLSWGLVARGGIFIAPLAVYNWIVQKHSITKQVNDPEFSALSTRARRFDVPAKPRPRSWFHVVFGLLSALLSGLLAVFGIMALIERHFEAGFGGIILACFLGWLASDWLRKRKPE
jgi:hypothetical protein